MGPTKSYGPVAAARPEATASVIPLIDGHFRVRYDKDRHQRQPLRHDARLHHIGLGRR